jgi:hypothetical protein
MTTSTDDDDAPLGDRQWYFGDIGGYVYTHGRRGRGPRWVSIVDGVGLTPSQARKLAALLLEAADDVEQSRVLP